MPPVRLGVARGSMTMKQSRRVVVAQPHGFCAGVRRALAILERAIRAHPEGVYCLNEIVHNRRVVRSLAERGVRFVKSPDEVPPGRCLVLSAHGVAPAVRKQATDRGLELVDATCPFVEILHREVRAFAARGLQILLIGRRGHDEIVGLQGEAPDSVRVIETRAEAETVPVRDTDQVAAVTQTTLATSEAEEILRILRRRFPRIETPDRAGICRATVARQEAVRRLARRVSAFVVLGSAHSSNTLRLVEVAREAGARAWVVDDLSELAAISLEDVGTLGLTAGASTPETFLDEVLEHLATRGFSRVDVARAVEPEMPMEWSDTAPGV